MGKNVGNLTDRDNVASGSARHVEKSWRGRGYRIISAVTGSGEAGCRLSDERPGNDTPNAPLVDQTARDLTRAIETGQSEAFFMRRDLEHAVGRRVADRLAGLHVLFTKLGDDGRPGGMRVPQCPR